MTSAAFVFSVVRTGNGEVFRFSQPDIGRFRKFLETAILSGVKSASVSAFYGDKKVDLGQGGWEPIENLAGMAGVTLKTGR